MPARIAPQGVVGNCGAQPNVTVKKMAQTANSAGSIACTRILRRQFKAGLRTLLKYGLELDENMCCQ
jgi:hypothetical protein